MKTAFRLTCFAILLLTFAGCGKKAQVPEKTIAAAYVDLEKTYEYGTYFSRVIINDLPNPSRTKAVNDLEQVLKTIDRYKDYLNPKWAVVAFGGTLSDLSRPPSENTAVVIAIDTDEKTAKNKLKEWVRERTGKEDAEPESHGNDDIYEVYSLYAGRIGNDYLIFALSKDAFMEMFNLYTGKAEPSKDFKELPRISGNTVARISTAPIHSLLSRLELTREVEKFGKASADEDLADMILNLGAVTLDVLAEGDDIGLSLRVTCGSPSDAKTIEHLFQAIAFISRAGFDMGAYLAENLDLLPDKFRAYKDNFRDARIFLNSAARSVDTAATRDGSIAEMTFATSIDIISKAIIRNESSNEKKIIPQKTTSQDHHL